MWKESPQYFAKEVNVVSLTATGWFLSKRQDLSCTFEFWCRLDHCAIKSSFPTIVQNKEWWVVFNKPYQTLTSLFLQWPSLLHSSYLNFEVLILLNWFPAWQSLRFRVMLIQQCPLQLLHVREDSPSAASAGQPRGSHGSFLMCSAFFQSQPAKAFQARGLPTVLYLFASPVT